MAEPHYLSGETLLPGTVGAVDDHFFRRYRSLLDAEDAVPDELEHVRGRRSRLVRVGSRDVAHGDRTTFKFPRDARPIGRRVERLTVAFPASRPSGRRGQPVDEVADERDHALGPPHEEVARAGDLSICAEVHARRRFDLVGSAEFVVRREHEQLRAGRCPPRRRRAPTETQWGRDPDPAGDARVVVRQRCRRRTTSR